MSVEGRILIDDQDHREGDAALAAQPDRDRANRTRSCFTERFSENIAYGRPGGQHGGNRAGPRGLRTRMSFILRLPNGYGTLVGERGVKLSGGERAAGGAGRGAFFWPTPRC